MAGGMPRGGDGSSGRKTVGGVGESKTALGRAWACAGE